MPPIAVFAKTRRERTTYAISAAPDVATGQTLSSPAVTLWRREASGWVDRTTEILEAPSVQVSGTDLEFTLRAAASATEQRSGLWQIRLGATRSDGAILTDHADEPIYLTVTD